MKKQQAKVLADKANAPYLKEYLKNNPMNELFAQIKQIAAAGLYSAEYKIPDKYPPSVIAYLCEELQNKYGYEVSAELDRKKSEYVLNISWA